MLSASLNKTFPYNYCRDEKNNLWYILNDGRGGRGVTITFYWGQYEFNYAPGSDRICVLAQITFVLVILAFTVRFLTRRFIGDYDPTLGKCDVAYVKQAIAMTTVCHTYNKQSIYDRLNSLICKCIAHINEGLTYPKMLYYNTVLGFRKHSGSNCGPVV